MVERKKNTLQEVASKVMQKLIKCESQIWPPDCMGFAYQAYRPEYPLQVSKSIQQKK